MDEPLPDGGLILFDTESRLILTLNATAAFVWECCDATHDLHSIVSQLHEIFPAAEEIERDVRSVLTTLCQARLIVDAGQETA